MKTQRPLQPVAPMNMLFYGENLAILREHVRDESVDLVYLDPPFNSSTAYNLIYRNPAGQQSDAQVEAFVDAWHWGEQAERELDELMHQRNTAVAEMVRALRRFLGESDLMAYLTMMTSRLLELRRILKPTGSLYLHCDPTASHYLKIVLDAIFGAGNFRNEIVWKRTNARGTEGRWPRVHDVLLFYSASENFTFKALKVKADKAKTPHTLITGADGNKYQTYELTAPGATKDGESGKPWRGYDPNKYGRHWGNAHAQMNAWDRAGLIHWPRKGGFPRRRSSEPFDAELRLTTVGHVWIDIDRINQAAAERLGYPTQKPVALLERIITASSNEGDAVLDPFCGCGTAIEASERLKRRWVGIDITHLAIVLVEGRLRRYPTSQFVVMGRPHDLAGARELAARDKYQFQYWVCSLVDAQPYGQKKKGADGGIDGLVHFIGHRKETEKIVVSVKGGANVSVQMVRDLRGVLERENAAIALFVTLATPTAPMLTEAAKAGFATYDGEKYPRIQILTVEDLLTGSARARHPGALLDPRPQKRRVQLTVETAQGDLFTKVARGKSGEVFEIAPPRDAVGPSRSRVEDVPSTKRAGPKRTRKRTAA